MHSTLLLLVYGLQPLQLIIVENQEIKKALVKHSYDQSQVQDSSHVLVICVERKLDKQYIVKYFNTVVDKRGTDPKVLQSFSEYLQHKFENESYEITLDWSKKQAYIALGNLLAACAMMKIDSCPIEGFISKKYDEILKLEDKGITSTLVLPIGYRSTEDEFAQMKKVRRSLSDTIHIV